MANHFADHGGGFDGEPRVYVNNMNTSRPTVDLPIRVHASFPQTRKGGGDAVGGRSRTPPLAGPSAAAVAAAAAPGGRPRSSNRSRAGSFTTMTAAAGGGAAAPHTTASGEVLHSNLQAVYGRIMRRLQRQMNYAELSRTTLAEQYGVDVELATEVAESKGEGSAQSSVPPSLAQRQQHVPTTGEAGEGVSRLLQFAQQSFPPATAGATMDALEGVAADDDGKVERDLTEQPCPRPLRLVLEHVTDTLLKKMRVAENSSVKDCIIFSFEARALLDRLLKEIPLYTQYAAYSIPVPGSAVTAVYQQLRKRPALLPRGEYVEDEATGAILAELVAETDANTNNASIMPAGRRKSSAAVFSRLPQLPSAQRTRNSTMRATQAAPAATTGEWNHTMTALPRSEEAAGGEMALPASYGRSTRLAAAQGWQGMMGGYAMSDRAPPPPSFLMSGNAKEAGGNDSARPGSGAAASSRGGPQRRTILRDHMGGCRTSAGDFLKGPDDISLQGSPNSSRTSEWAGDSGDEFGFLGPSATAHRRTRRVDVGTVTDENTLTTVSQEEHDALRQQTADLTMALQDAELHRNCLATQLATAEAYSGDKKRIVQYLRETLIRECNLLRAQVVHSAAATSNRAQASSRAGGAGGAVAASSSSVWKENASLQNTARTLRASEMAQLGNSHNTVTMPSPPSRRGAADHANESESSVSVAGGNASAARFTRGNGKHRGAGGAGATGAGSGVRRVSSSTAAQAAARAEQLQMDMESVMSLLDLALLAVEEDAVLPPQTAELLRSRPSDKEYIRNNLQKNMLHQLEDARVQYESRAQEGKVALLQKTAEHHVIVAAQAKEVARLRAMTDTTAVHAVLRRKVRAVRTDLHRLHGYVKNQLRVFVAMMQTTTHALVQRAALVDTAMNDNVVLRSTVSANESLIQSANSLLLPMLTHEYECGYHPWPLKLRNTKDPLYHVIQSRFGAAEVVHLRDSLTQLGQLYVAIHQYVMRQVVVPDSTRPATGKALEVLCAALALNPMSHSDVVFAARRFYDAEGQLRKRMAKLRALILWNAYLQHIYTERSLAALEEVGLDLRVAPLPVARRVSVLAMDRATMVQTLLGLQRERSENAKTAFRFWQERGIDVLEGYPAPQTQRNRLALLGGAQGSFAVVAEGGGLPAVGMRPARQPKATFL